MTYRSKNIIIFANRQSTQIISFNIDNQIHIIMNTKHLSIIIVALILGVNVYSQTSFTSLTARTYSMGNKFEHILVKEHHYPNTVTCNIYDTLTDPFTAFGYQYIQDSSIKSRYIFLKGYIVNDFDISNDSVFFCGYDSLRNAIIGFFNIDDLFFNNGDFYIQNEFYTQDIYEHLNHRVERLNKLVTYQTQSHERHIVCIGYINDSIMSLNSGCVVDMYYRDNKEADIRPSSLWGYTSGLLYKTLANSLLDIAIISNWVITAGFENSNYITLRTYIPEDIFSLTGPQNNYREFSILPSSSEFPYAWNPDELHLAFLTGDTIATAASWINITSGQRFARKVNIAKYHLNTFNGNIAPTMLSLKEITFECLYLIRFCDVSAFLISANIEPSAQTLISSLR